MIIFNFTLLLFFCKPNRKQLSNLLAERTIITANSQKRCQPALFAKTNT